MKKYRVMVQGEDGMLWCEKNDIGEDEAQNIADDCVENRYENAQSWIESEEPPVFWDDHY